MTNSFVRGRVGKRSKEAGFRIELTNKVEEKKIDGTVTNFRLENPSTYVIHQSLISFTKNLQVYPDK